MALGLRPLVFGFFFLLCGSIWYVTVEAQENRQVAAVIPNATENQRKIKADTEKTARRLDAVLRLLAYHKIDSGMKQKFLKETSDTLSKLSRDEMSDVLTFLDKAAKATDPDKATDEQRKAYQKHREIIDQLRAMTLKNELIESLELASRLLHEKSKAQSDLRISTETVAQAIRDRRSSPRRGPVDDLQEQAETQFDLNRDVDHIFNQLAVIEKLLDAEQKERLRESNAIARGKSLMDLAKEAQQLLKQSNPTQAGPIQEKVANELLDLSNALKGPRDPLSALREAEQKIDKAIKDQAELKNDTAKPPENRKGQVGIDSKLQHAREMAQKQAKLEFETRETRAMLKDVKEAAEKVKPAEEAMRKAVEELRKTTTDFNKPVEKQEKATDALKEAKQVVKDLIDKEKARRTDPLEAVKAAKEKVDQLIKDQTKTKEDTEATKGTQTEKMPALVKDQKDLAKRTEDVKNTPLPEKAEAKQALDKAAKAMENAAKALETKKGLEAVKNQDAALKDLQAASKALDEQAQAIAERAKEIDALKEAAKELGKLAEQQGEIAKKADDAEKKGKADDAPMLAKEQDALKPQAKEIGDMIKDLAPEAAKKIDEAGPKMDAAKQNLDKKELPPAAKNADEAKNKLEEAQKEVAKKLDEKNAMKAIDEAALNPNVDPKNAADQVAKALEQAKQAMMQADMAADKLGMPMMGMPMMGMAKMGDPKMGDPKMGEPMMGMAMMNPAADLQKLQEQVAQKAKDLMNPEAQKAADMAAQALQMGELQKAVENQQKAIEALQPMGMGMPMMAQPMMGMAKMGDPKMGEPMMGMAKMGEHKMGMGMPMMGEPKMGMGMA
ncbi:MAG: DUF4175 family protein, partial [Planctomycetes bacterium]|nr:DUF4175 family protein [Planctomycetota bacterium]